MNSIEFSCVSLIQELFLLPTLRNKIITSVVLDRGLQFAAELTKELNKMLGIQTKLSTAFNPQTDGQTECMNQELEQYL